MTQNQPVAAALSALRLIAESDIFVKHQQAAETAHPQMHAD